MDDEGRAQGFVAGNEPDKGRQSRARGLVLFVVLPGLAVTLAPRARHVADPRAITTTLDEAAARFSAPDSSNDAVRARRADPREDPLRAADGPNVTDAEALTKGLSGQLGPELRVAPGRYAGNFTVSAAVNVACETSLPAGRVTPEDVSACQIVALDRLKPVMKIAASNVAVRGMTITGVAPDRTVVVIGSNRATDVTTQPANVTLDQNAILGLEGRGHRGIEAHGARVTITRNHIAGFLEQRRQSQGIYAANGPGPYLIEDNYIEASGENILFGGDDPRIAGLVPSDIAVRGNLLFKPQEWRQKKGSVANLLELKNAQRVLIEHNVLDGNWTDIQSGIPVVFTPRNQYGRSPWTVVADVVFRHNMVKNTPAGLSVTILGTDNNFPSRQTARIRIEHNLFLDARSGVQVIGGVADALVITRNTWPAIRWKVLGFDGSRVLKTPLTFTGNVFPSGQYGVAGTNTSPGTPTLAAYTTLVDFTGNVIEKTASVSWPPGNTLVARGTLADRLDAESRYRGSPGDVGW
jgi:Right handed beta helix region